MQVANELLALYRKRPDGLPEVGLLSIVRYQQFAQVLVDEATDFSSVQLACMHELAHPAFRSFFLCGDLNQRLTAWGITSNQAIDWIAPKIERRDITVSYRQSGRLVDLAKDVAKIGGSEVDDIVLPGRLDENGVAPVWQTKLKDNAEIAQWLANRIKEIEQTVGEVPTIAVLVNEEEQVETLASELNRRLADINLSASACKDGQIIGNDNHVRVFCMQHIKGLEFEAAFFVSLDQTVQKHPDLYPKYLYVGATRAAMYLGITFSGNIPPKVEALSQHFETDWSS